MHVTSGGRSVWIADNKQYYLHNLKERDSGRSKNNLKFDYNINTDQRKLYVML
jgi:hypothetical protein